MKYFSFPYASRSCLKDVQIVLILLAGVSCSLAQNTPKLCPELELIGPTRILEKNQTTEFSLVDKKSGKELEAAEVKWAVSAGSIIKGNGTSRVIYLADGKTTEPNVKISAALRESVNNCGAFLTLMFGVLEIRTSDDDKEEFGKQKPGEVKARLDNFYIQLNNNPDLEGFWTIQFEKQATPYYSRSMIRRVLDLIKFRRYDASRLSFYILEDSDLENTAIWISNLDHAFTGHGVDKSKLIKAEEISGKLNKLFPRK